MQETIYQTTDAGVILSDSGYRKHSIRHRMQKSLYQTSDAGVSQSDSGCRMQETLYQTADAEVSLSDTVAGDTLIEILLHPLFDRETPASAV